MTAPSHSFIASIAEALRTAHVPCVLWDSYLLNVHGIPSVIGSLDFVISDCNLRIAMKVLSSLVELQECNDGSCLVESNDRYTPPPAHHVHVNGSEIPLGLHLQSETLWFLPELNPILMDPSELEASPHFTVASDKTTLPPYRPGRGSGVFKSSEPPVVVPRPIVLLEAALRLYARDCRKKIGSCAMRLICYIDEYVDDDGYLGKTKLPEPLQQFYEELKFGKKLVRQWTMELEDALGVQRDEAEVW